MERWRIQAFRREAASSAMNATSRAHQPDNEKTIWQVRCVGSGKVVPRKAQGIRFDAPLGANNSNDTLSAGIAFLRSATCPASAIALENPHSPDQNNDANDTLSAGPSDSTAPTPKTLAAQMLPITARSNINDTLSALPWDATALTDLKPKVLKKFDRMNRTQSQLMK